MKIKTCRREAKESRYWLRLVITDGAASRENERIALMEEAKELALFFSTILKNQEINENSKRQEPGAK